MKPDYARIAQLERELGMNPPAVTRRRVCLLKDCCEEIRLTTWGGTTMRVVTTHRKEA